MPIRAVAFSLDETLAESKQPISPEVATGLIHLAGLVPFCILTVEVDSPDIPLTEQDREAGGHADD